MRPSPYLAGTSRRDERPPTYFFVKKIQPSRRRRKFRACSVTLIFSAEGEHCAAYGIPQSGLPPVGGIPAMPRTFLRNVWERGPPLLRRSGGGGRIPMGAEIPPTRTYRSEALSPSVQEPCAAQEVPRTQEGAFFFTKKAYCVNRTLCVAGRGKSVQTQPPPPSALKKPFQIMGIQGDVSPWQALEGGALEVLPFAPPQIRSGLLELGFFLPESRGKLVKALYFWGNTRYTDL